MRDFAAANVNTSYVAQYNQTNTRWELIERVAASDTLLGSSNATLTPSQVYQVTLVMNGTAISMVVDGVTIIGPITNATISLAGFPGLYLRWTADGGANTAVDNFSADTLGGGASTPFIPGTIMGGGYAIGGSTGRMYG